MAEFDYPPVDFQTDPSRYVHWDLDVDGQIATLTMHVKEDHPMWEGRYDLKLNSYDLGVDIELNDAIQRLRFEHPQVRCVRVEGAYPKIFCAGANIRFLGGAPHAFKVNFCKYTNETRVSIEDASANSGQRYIAALNGTASGGGYELALACEEIYLIDDGNAAVSLPEVPLLGVLPGTGGLTRITDKRKIRRDVADVFCTKAEGFRARDATRYNFIDGSWPRSKWDDGVAGRCDEIVAELNAALPDKPTTAGQGIVLAPVVCDATADSYTYRSVRCTIDGRVAQVTMLGPDGSPTRDAETWSLRAFRELEDCLLRLRVNHLDVGVLVLKTEGDPAAVHQADTWVREGRATDWWLHEVYLLQARVLRKVDNMAKSMFALIEPGHCFVGSLFELTLAADRSYMLADDDDENTIQLSASNAGMFPMASGLSRLHNRFPADPAHVDVVLAKAAEPVHAEDAEELGLTTASPDDIDYEDEIRIAIEERVSLSPDALTGMEQNLRFGGAETCETKIYGRLSAWQNWIFQRPNAVGKRGALTMYGHPERPVFDYRRT